MVVPTDPSTAQRHPGESTEASRLLRLVRRWGPESPWGLFEWLFPTGSSRVIAEWLAVTANEYSTVNRTFTLNWSRFHVVFQLIGDLAAASNLQDVSESALRDVTSFASPFFNRAPIATLLRLESLRVARKRRALNGLLRELGAYYKDVLAVGRDLRPKCQAETFATWLGYRTASQVRSLLKECHSCRYRLARSTSLGGQMMKDPINAFFRRLNRIASAYSSSHMPPEDAIEVSWYVSSAYLTQSSRAKHTWQGALDKFCTHPGVRWMLQELSRLKEQAERSSLESLLAVYIGDDSWLDD